MAERPPRGQSTFRQRDLTAAIKAARAGGVQSFTAEVSKDGTIRIIVTAEVAAIPRGNPWDDED